METTASCEDAHDTRFDPTRRAESPRPDPIERSFLPAAPSSISSPLRSSSDCFPAPGARPVVPRLNLRTHDAANPAPFHSRSNAPRRAHSDGHLTTSHASVPATAAAAATLVPCVAATRAQSASGLRDRGTSVVRNDALDPPPPPSNAADQTLPAGTVAPDVIAGSEASTSPRDTIERVQVVYATPGPLYLDLFSREDGTGARIKGFRRNEDGAMAATEASGRVCPGDDLVAMNGVDVSNMALHEIMTMAHETAFPLTLTFHCHVSNKDDAERNTTRMERKQSSAPLPPTSPSSRVGWGTKWSPRTQRTSSFEQLHTSSACETTSHDGPTLESSHGGKFGLVSLGKVGTDGVKKSLFRMMGTKAARPEEDKAVVQAWMHELALKPHTSATGRRQKKAAATQNVEILHSTPLVAVTTGGRFVGVLDEDRNEFALSWFRKLPSESAIREIKGIKRCPYFPSVDDVGAIVSLQCVSLRFPPLQRVVELPTPLVLDPDVGNTVNVFLETGAGSFSATLASNEHDSFQLKISAEGVTLVKISEFEEGGVVVTASYGPFLQVHLDPSNPLQFTLKVQEFGALLGHRPGDVCDLTQPKTPMHALSCFFLVAQNRQNRDILTLLIRTFRARSISPEHEQLAQADERELFVDPAYLVAMPPSPPAALSCGASPAPTLSPSSTVAATGETASTVGSPPPTAAAASPAGSSSSPGAHHCRVVSEGSSSSVSGARLSDLIGLEPAESGPDTREHKASSCVSGGTAPRASPRSSKDRVRATSGAVGVETTCFVNGRLAAQNEEISMLREKLASLSIRLKAAQQEKQLVLASIAVKDNRIEAQQQKLRHLEKLVRQCDHHVHEMHTMRSKWEDEARRHAACRRELDAVVAARASSGQDQSVQTESEWVEDEMWHGDTGSGTVERARDVVQQVKDHEVTIAHMEEAHVKLVAERNAFRAKSMELAKEVRRLLDGKVQGNNRLDAELVAIKTEEARRRAEEVTALKQALACGSDQGTERLVAEQLALQHTVHALQTALREARDQVDAVTKTNRALASQLEQLAPETGGKLEDVAPRASSLTGHDAVSSDEDEDDEDEEDEALRDGLAAFRRSLVGVREDK
ncbi:hypothetical protein PsorP6_011966 [Peronosclerospora sorghi]|uniref:Uncharacterized protein n=1 Tax=Peronosclerospora sorghi TaxID=230839 RepID=A0ACC0WJI7_9STRA|nr:hypothetical protein PsorP6_011966 [Peronosclerospora sorghi]